MGPGTRSGSFAMRKDVVVVVVTRRMRHIVRPRGRRENHIADKSSSSSSRWESQAMPGCPAVYRTRLRASRARESWGTEWDANWAG